MARSMQRRQAMLDRLRSESTARRGRISERSVATTAPRRSYLSDTSGAIMTEYAVVVGVCGIVISLAIASLGVPLVSGYGTARTILISTVP
jgi:Flp pilus assembly pilin Flp